MKKMTNSKKIKILYSKLIILILCFFIILRIISLVLARYESEASGIANVDVAFYLLKEDYQTMTLNLDSYYPVGGTHVYTFSIGNCDGLRNAEIDIEYDLTIRTTTNLPLRYDLYMNEEYDDDDAQSIITSNVVALDEYNTYFRTIRTNSIFMRYTQSITNVYQLVVYYPETLDNGNPNNPVYNSENYQNIIDMIEITIDGRQKTS